MWKSGRDDLLFCCTQPLQKLQDSKNVKISTQPKPTFHQSTGSGTRVYNFTTFVFQRQGGVYTVATVRVVVLVEYMESPQVNSVLDYQSPGTYSSTTVVLLCTVVLRYDTVQTNKQTKNTRKFFHI